MANIFGYNQLYSTEPEIWFVDGYIPIAADGYSVATGAVLPKEVLSLVHNSTGNFTLKLKHCWYSLQAVDVKTEIPSTDTPAVALVQIDSDNVGAAGTLDGDQGVTFRLVTTAGSPTDLGANSGLKILIVLKRNSA